MTLINKTPGVKSFRMLLFQRALHPELFGIEDRHTFTGSEYELESWLMPGGHALRFQINGHCFTETVADTDIHLPQRGLVHTTPCIGEKEFDETLAGKVKYVSSLQTEQLSENLFNASYKEMKDFARDNKAQCFEWKSEYGSKNMSIIDLQPFKYEVHAQSYHLIGGTALILRTQTIFELIRS